MIGFCGYDFCMNKNTLNPLPMDITDIDKITIRNAIFDHINLEKNADFIYSEEKPQWNLDTVLDCDFTKGIGAGNVEFTLAQLSAIKIKRRKFIPQEEEAQYVFDKEMLEDLQWVTIKEIPINTSADLKPIIKDYLVPSKESFEYAVVPILNGIEGNYIKGIVATDFNGVFISDATNNFRLYNEVSYGNNNSIQEVGYVTPLGRQFPVIIKNGQADYETGSVSAILLGKDYDKTHLINRKEVVEQVNKFRKFLKNDKPKILKDWNGNIWIVYIINNPNISYNNNYGMGVGTTSFEWIEQGKYNSEEDLYRNELIEINNQ